MRKTGKIEDLCCAHCAEQIREKIAALDGVHEVSISFITQKIVLDAADEKFDTVFEQVKKIVNKIEPDCKVVF